jgi:hypothetical protein
VSNIRYYCPKGCGNYLMDSCPVSTRRFRGMIDLVSDPESCRYMDYCPYFDTLENVILKRMEENHGTVGRFS